jgi:hypothetical protein
VVASGQEIAVNASGSEIGFLDTTTYGPADGQGMIIYANGTTQSFTLDVPDWYCPPTGVTPVITMAYRNTPGNGQDHPGPFGDNPERARVAWLANRVLPRDGDLHWL